MGTVIRAGVSKKNLWYIPKHRYYELKHFCMQYPDWKREKSELSGHVTVSAPDRMVTEDCELGRPTETTAERLTYFQDRINMVETAAKLTDELIGEIILTGIVQGLSYDVLYARRPIPCCRDSYYVLYRKFFYILSRLRG